MKKLKKTLFFCVFIAFCTINACKNEPHDSPNTSGMNYKLKSMTYHCDRQGQGGVTNKNFYEYKNDLMIKRNYCEVLHAYGHWHQPDSVTSYDSLIYDSKKKLVRVMSFKWNDVNFEYKYDSTFFYSDSLLTMVISTMYMDTLRYSYYPDKRIKKIDVHGKYILYSYSYEYSHDSINHCSYMYSIYKSNDLPEQIFTYKYDSLNRLVKYSTFNYYYNGSQLIQIHNDLPSAKTIDYFYYYDERKRLIKETRNINYSPHDVINLPADRIMYTYYEQLE